MRKGVVIAGAVVLIIGVAALGAGFYSLFAQSGLGNLGVNAQKTTVVITPGKSATIGMTALQQITVVAYTDNVSAPLQVTSGGATPTTRTANSHGETNFIVVFVTVSSASGSGPVVMQNNQTKTVTVQYAAVQTSVGALAYGGLALLGGGVLFVAGLIVLIVGLVMKKRTQPAPQGAQIPMGSTSQ